MAGFLRKVQFMFERIGNQMKKEGVSSYFILGYNFQVGAGEFFYIKDKLMFNAGRRKSPALVLLDSTAPMQKHNLLMQTYSANKGLYLLDEIWSDTHLTEVVNTAKGKMTISDIVKPFFQYCGEDPLTATLYVQKDIPLDKVVEDYKF